MKRPLILAGALVALAVIAIIGAVAVQLLRSDNVDLANEAPRIPTTTPALAASSTPRAGDPPPAVSLPAGVFRFVIDAANSKATYVVREKLTRLPLSSNAVGETSSISGDLYLTASGLAPNPTSQFKVDLRTLRSDESLRDTFIRTTTLRANQFPFAEFVIESLTGFPAGYVEGTEVSLFLAGQMKIRETSRPLTFQVKARKLGDTLTAIADTEFKMTDFGISPPDVTLAKAEDGVRLQVQIVAKLAS